MCIHRAKTCTFRACKPVPTPPIRHPLAAGWLHPACPAPGLTETSFAHCCYKPDGPGHTSTGLAAFQLHCPLLCAVCSDKAGLSQHQPKRELGTAANQRGKIIEGLQCCISHGCFQAPSKSMCSGLGEVLLMKLGYMQAPKRSQIISDNTAPEKSEKWSGESSSAAGRFELVQEGFFKAGVASPSIPAPKTMPRSGQKKQCKDGGAFTLLNHKQRCCRRDTQFHSTHQAVPQACCIASSAGKSDAPGSGQSQTETQIG